MYPILINIQQLSVLVVGGGKIATRKIMGLVKEGGYPTVIAPTVTRTLTELAENGKIILHQRFFQIGDTADFHLIFICTNDEAVNQLILQEVTPQQLINDTTNQQRSNFFNMIFMKEKDIGLAITTGGKSPEKAKHLKAAVRAFLQSLEKN